jgi:hypothetical protein
MSKVTLPNVSPVAEVGLQKLSSPGIRISGPQSVSQNKPFTISGRFIVDEKEFKRLGGSPHRDLVLTVLSEPMYGSYHPLKGCLFFKDDIQQLSGAYSGWFTLDVWAYSGFQTEGTYHIRVSLGEALSNVIETRVLKDSSASHWEGTA